MGLYNTTPYEKWHGYSRSPIATTLLGHGSSVIRQIGNAVPCELAFRVASPLCRLIDESFTRSESRQHNMTPPSEADGLDLTQEPRLQPMHSLAFGRLV